MNQYEYGLTASSKETALCIVDIVEAYHAKSQLHSTRVANSHCRKSEECATRLTLSTGWGLHYLYCGDRKHIGVRGQKITPPALRRVLDCNSTLPFY